MYVQCMHKTKCKIVLLGYESDHNFVPRLSFMGRKESLARTDCACINISGNFSSGHYQQTHGLCTYTTVSRKYTETN